jgi:NADH:ubiquinone oxidoreductase subunit 6 (subunit J)
LDSTLAIIFYVCTGLAVAAALAAIVGPGAWRAGALLIMALGAAASVAVLSAFLAALVGLVSLGGAALLVGGLAEPGGRAAASSPGPARSFATAEPATQIGAVAAAGLLIVLLYASARGAFHAHPAVVPGLNEIGRALFGRDALALEAVAGLLLIAFSGLSVTMGRRR